MTRPPIAPLGVDHLVYAVPDLESGVAAVEGRLGARASPGGRHPAWGTRNALVPLGETVYLEIIGPDADRSDPDIPQLFGISELDAPRLATWAVRRRDLGAVVREAAKKGLDLGTVTAGTRRRSDGVTLSWRLTDPFAEREAGVVPFFIDWGAMPHPAEGADRSCSLLGLRAEHPESDRVGSLLERLGVDLDVSVGPAPALIATIETPRGVTQLE